MRITVGQKLFSVVDTTAAVVVRSPDEDVTVTCGGQEMLPQEPPRTSAPPPSAEGAGLLLGKRYVAEVVAVELLCIRAGQAPVAVGDVPVEQKAAKALPASD